MIGQTISHYQILEKLGEGGMGVVYKAQDLKLDRLVALKFLPPHLAADEKDKQRFVNEAKAASALDHPNICTIHEVDETRDGQLFIAMAHYEGETLHQKIVNRQLSIDDCITFAIQTAEGLQAAHKKGITHRDIKSSNIMVTPEGQVKIMDFGLAKTTGATMLTKSGATVGTVPYMSPEQARGEKVDHRTDIWSLGVVLYELISGRLPFQSPYSEAIVYSILNEEPKPFSLVRSDVPAEVESVVKKCLEKNQANRYQHMDDILVDLRREKAELGKEAPRAKVPKPTKFQRRNWYLIGGAALLIGLLLFIFLPRFTSRDEVIQSIAVLPFANTTGDPNTEYLSDGIAEGIINSLSQLSQLRVMARSTVFRYKDKDVDPQKVGHELRVRAVLTGRLIQQGDNLTIRTELVNVEEGTQLWGQQYNRKLADLFEVQEEIAKEISEKLRLKLTGAEKQQLAKRPTENLKAFQYYMQGRAYAQRRTREDLLAAIRYFEKAIQEDQNYALAYSGLSDAYGGLGVRGYIAPVEGRRKAEEYARKAVALDENLAEAHATLGLAYVLFAPYNFSQGDRELRRAIELSPSLAIGHQYLGVSLTKQARFDEGLEEFLKARERDPLSSIIARLVSLPYYLKRDYVRALELVRQANELGSALSSTWEIEVYIRSGLFDEALAELEKAKRERNSDPLLIYDTGIVYAAQRKRAEALQIIKELEEISGAGVSQAQWIAKIYAILNEKELALTWLVRGLAAGPIGGFYKDEPVWDPLRGDPRFNDLLKKMGLPTSESDKGSFQPIIEKPKTEPSSEWQNSIAVLPFKNISSDKEQEYFCDGMTEQLITNLTNLQNVKVIARTSVMQFKNRDRTIQQIANELGVAHVLEGSVRKSGNKVRVTAQLIKADDGFHLWAKDYDRQLKDIFAVQDDVSNAIVRALKVNLPVSRQHSMVATAPKNTEAHDLFLRGNFFLHKSDQESLNRAFEYFQKSIEKDRSYAPPYAGIANAYAILADAYLPPKDAYPKAKSFALKALELDSTIAEARAALAFILGAYERDWLSSQREFRRAMEFNPNSVDVLWLSALGLGTESAEAIALADRAIALDPLNPFASWTKENVLYAARQFDQVIEQHKRTVELDPNFFYGDSWVGIAYRERGMLKEALEEYTKVQKQMPGQPLFGLAALYARMGKRQEAKNILRDLINESTKRYIAPTGIAFVYIALGEKDQAFDWLDRAYEAHDTFLNGLKTDTRYDPIRSDPRFDVLLKKMGFAK